LPVIATIGSPSCRRIEARFTTSSVSPEYDRHSAVSVDRNRPRSPWAASDGCTECEGIPSDASVALILAPISPDLPRPVTSTVPPARAHESSRSTASMNAPPSDDASAESDSASWEMIRAP